MTRNDQERLCLVVNPHSAGGGTGRRLDALRRAADRWFTAWEIRETQGPGHATAVAAEAVAHGFDVIASVGGDGTASETVNGLFEHGVARRPGVVFGAVPAGTGSDLVRTLGMPRELDAALAALATGSTRASDVLDVHVTPHGGGALLRRACINVLGFGINGEVVQRANRSAKRLGGTLTFLGASLGAMASYAPPQVDLKWTDAEGDDRAWSGPVMAAFVANGQYCGGGMWVGRGGTMQDGHADLIVVPRLPMLSQLAGLPNLYTGRVDRVSGVIKATAITLEASAPDPGRVLVDVDGEQPGTLPVKVRMLPGMLNVRGLWA